MRLRLSFASFLVGCGLLASGLSGCTNSLTSSTNTSALCEAACSNFTTMCGGVTSSTLTSSGTAADCVPMCESGIGSKSGSSGAQYKDMLSCVANAKSCVEIQNVCTL